MSRIGILASAVVIALGDAYLPWWLAVAALLILVFLLLEVTE